MPKLFSMTTPLCRYPEIHALSDPTEEEKVEADAKEKRFQLCSHGR